MASQALYRKWRSQTFDELVGQEHVVQTLQNAIQTGRIGHAYLFTGPRGVGKTTMARLLAKAVNCEASLEQRPCDRCYWCRLVVEGGADDVIEMDAASHTSVDDARLIIERVHTRPTIGSMKVYIIDEVHMLSTAAFNALLKTLEEPPAHALFILATTEFHKVPATIISRCQRFVFTRHAIANIMAHLEHIAREEGITLEEGVAERIARAATGAMRDAISILDQLIAGSDDTIALAQVHGLLGATDTGKVGALVDALIEGDVQAALHVVNEVADDGADLRQFARDLVERLRGLMLLSASGDHSALDVPAETLQEMQRQASETTIGQLVAWLKLFSNLDYQLKNSPYGQLPLELAVVEALVAPAPMVAQPGPRPSASKPVAPTSKRTSPAPSRQAEAANGQAQSVETPAVHSEPPQERPQPKPPVEELLPPVPEVAEVAPEPVVAPVANVSASPQHVIEVVDDAAFFLEDVEACWTQVVEDIRALNRLIYTQLDGVMPINVEDRTVVLLAQKGDWQKKKLEVDRTQRLIERELTRALGGQCFIRITIDEQEEMPDINKQIQHVRKDELVRSAINIFDATIIAIDQPE
ncbi:MAG TPA: DNA polymerase III subunit gamma/tau [Herpetosiphonaceae bacterium]